VLHECTLVLEGVTLAEVIEVLVNLASGAVLDEQAAEDTQTTHPHHLTVTPCQHPEHIQSSQILPYMFKSPLQQPARTYVDIGVNLRRHPGISSTLPLTKTPVPSNPAGCGQLPRARARVHGDGLANDEAIGDEFADRLAAVGVGDFVHFVRVEPDLAFAAVGHGRRQALLRAEVHPIEDIVC
jgi:hypothetical protein